VEFWKYGVDARRSQQYLVSKKAEWVGLEINLHNKVTTKTYGSAYEMPCISGTRGRRKRRKLRLWVACLSSVVPRCAAGSFVVWSVGLAVSVCDPHRAETLGRNSNVPKSPPLALHVRVRTLPPSTFDPSVSFHAHTVPPYQAFRSCSSLHYLFAFHASYEPRSSDSPWFDQTSCIWCGFLSKQVPWKAVTF